MLPPSVLQDISPTWREIGSFEVGDWLISPLVGEMSGRTEGGNVKRHHCQSLSSPQLWFRAFAVRYADRSLAFNSNLRACSTGSV